MKKYLQMAGAAVVIVLIVSVTTLRIFGYAPQDQSPGLWLSGELVNQTMSDWSFSDRVDEIFVQTRTPYLIPHSVTTYCVTYNEQFYLFSAYYSGGDFPDARRWNQNVVRDPRVRLKIGDQLFDQTLIYVENESIRRPVHQAFADKYPQWTSPGLENVHIFLVQ
ncbi:MAG: hypothetical protein O2971_08800 [Proteobacteria bacterium]|nr:hypothetical protein [Pseudomonadota bacterium]